LEGELRMPMPNELKHFETLQNQLHQEYIALLRDKLVHKKDTPQDMAEVALKSMIISVLPDCILDDEKIKELLDSHNALEMLFTLCKSVIEHDSFEINDMISCCVSFEDEIKKQKKRQMSSTEIKGSIFCSFHIC